MANPHVDRLKKQVSNLEGVMEQLMKKLDENTNKMDSLNLQTKQWV
jgi:prefoldin subunit 5